jgi:hypothetical protein
VLENSWQLLHCWMTKNEVCWASFRHTLFCLTVTCDIYENFREFHCWILSLRTVDLCRNNCFPEKFVYVSNIVTIFMFHSQANCLYVSCLSMCVILLLYEKLPVLSTSNSPYDATIAVLWIIQKIKRTNCVVGDTIYYWRHIGNMTYCCLVYSACMRRGGCSFWTSFDYSMFLSILVCISQFRNCGRWKFKIYIVTDCSIHRAFFRLIYLGDIKWFVFLCKCWLALYPLIQIHKVVYHSLNGQLIACHLNSITIIYR